MRNCTFILLATTAILSTGCLSKSLDNKTLANASSASTYSNETTSSISSLTASSPVGTAEWKHAYELYERQAENYWNRVAELRKVRNDKRARGLTIAMTDYVLTQPPVYNGPPRPSTGGSPSTGQRPSIPTIDDFIAASQKVYGFTPQRPSNEQQFMQAYARQAQKAGFSRDQLVAIYAFETGGNGTYDLQAGMLPGKKEARPISTAMGYHQLVATASVSVMWEYGQTIANELRQRAASSNASERKQLLYKADVIDRMTRQAKTVPHQWGEQAKLAKTQAGLGIHAMLLDKDVGPMLQIHKLATSLAFLRRKGVNRNLSGAELEMLNLTGDGNGYDMISMPVAYRDKIPTSNFFVRNGYERNPVAKHNSTVARLLQATEEKMRNNMKQDGAMLLNQSFSANLLSQR